MIPTGEQDEAARVLQAASEQIELALQQAQPSVEALGEALGRLAALLADPGSAGRTQALQAMRAEMLRAIIGLQYHDRMTQHLTHVREYLADSAAQLGSRAGGDAWRGLHSRLHDRLRSGAPREGFTSAKSGEIDLF